MGEERYGEEVKYRKGRNRRRKKTKKELKGVTEWRRRAWRKEECRKQAMKGTW